MMLEIPMLKKLNTKIEPNFDCSSSKLYDKGENIYIPLDGKLTTEQFVFLPNQAFTQMGLSQQTFYALNKESYNHRVLIIKVINIWPHLDYEIKEDLKYLQLITQNKLLNKYSTLPTFLFQYLDRIIVMHRQLMASCFRMEDKSFIILKERPQQSQNADYMAQKNQDIQYLTLFGECDVKLTLHNPELMLKSAVLQFDSPKYAQQSVIKDIKTIKELIKGEDYQQLRQKLNEVFGKKISDQQQQFTIQQIQQQQQQLQQNSVRQRTSSNQDDSNQLKKQVFRRIYFAREIDKTQKEQPSLGEIKKINYTPLRNRQSRVKMNNSNIRQKTIENQQQNQQSAVQQQCLPIIKSFVNMEEYQQQQQQMKKKKDQQRKRHIQNKFIEFDKILNQLIK
ncbi:unnamed protein product (macronuclear) [Paramecium tetraurelia]|uniref:Cyclic nucleotide-binding domain-containing protein n=1 Tax=Paramecium tetraurelia TaxID=5888 RepID=A0DQN6_PARTE|nr:uncharacterized protein GSPATT00002753001 [Paramecium tetraurelia]CAK85353.1 unnamed protein product [Paramecium tetraurelia]|eukprot:XP_001452750.1 hypothetical protein (macronuclear) [Paramecium tetraurelia strain d4-2]